MSRVTTDPAPITESSPMVTPGMMIAPPPIQTLSPMVIGSAASQPSRRGPGSSGWIGVSSWMFGPSWQLRPMRMSTTSRAVSPKFTKVPSPIWRRLP